MDWLKNIYSSRSAFVVFLGYAEVYIENKQIHSHKSQRRELPITSRSSAKIINLGYNQLFLCSGYKSADGLLKSYQLLSDGPINPADRHKGFRIFGRTVSRPLRSNSHTQCKLWLGKQDWTRSVNILLARALARFFISS